MPSTRTSSSLDSVPMAVSILSSECRPWRSLPALKSVSSAGSNDRRRCASGRPAGTDWRSENSASRKTSTLSVAAPPGPARSSPPRTRASASWRSRPGRRPGSAASTVSTSSARPMSTIAIAASARSFGGTPMVGQRVVQLLRPLLGRLPQLDAVGCRLVAAAQGKQRQQQATAASRMTPLAGARMCVDVTCKDRSVKTSGIVCRSGRLRITSRHLMCFSERRARLRRHRGAYAGAGAAGIAAAIVVPADAPPARRRRRRSTSRSSAACRSPGRRRPTWGPSTGIRPRSGWSAASS